MVITAHHGAPDDADTPNGPSSPDVTGHVLSVTPAEAEPVSWPARHFAVDPASSPVLMAAFAWAPRTSR